MSKETVTTWTCNRCGAQEQTKVGDRHQMPANWIAPSYKMLRSKEEQELGHLCNTCGGYLVSFVNGTLEQDMEKDARVAELTAKLEETKAELQELKPSPLRTQSPRLRTRLNLRLEDEDEDDD